jgi:hypothetical protein
VLNRATPPFDGRKTKLDTASGPTTEPEWLIFGGEELHQELTENVQAVVTAGSKKSVWGDDMDLVADGCGRKAWLREWSAQ